MALTKAESWALDLCFPPQMTFGQACPGSGLSSSACKAGATTLFSAHKPRATTVFSACKPRPITLFKVGTVIFFLSLTTRKSHPHANDAPVQRTGLIFVVLILTPSPGHTWAVGGVGNTLRTHAGVLGASAFGAGNSFLHPLLSRCGCCVRPRRYRRVCRGCGIHSALNLLPLPAEPPLLLGSWSVFCCLVHHAVLEVAIPKGAFPLGWEEPLSLGYVRQGTRVQVA